MRRAPISIRLNNEELDALRRAAAADRRPPATLIRLILIEWLAENGYLSNTEIPARG